MYSGNQTTILNEALFFGKPKNMEKVVNVKLLPAEANYGIVFKRTDLKTNNIIKANFENAYIEKNKLVLKNEHGATINDAELLLAGIWAGKLDNLLIEIDGEAVPYIDGTTEPLSFVITIGRTKELEKTRKVFEVENEIGVKINGFEVSLKPSQSFIINLKESSDSFEFDNSILPFKDWLSKISDESNEKIKYDVISIISIVFLSNKYCTFEASLKNFDKKITFDFFKNLFKK